MTTRITFSVFLLLLLTTLSSGQGGVGIGTTSPNNKSIMELSSTSKGFLFPRLTYTQRTGITAPIPEGLLVYQTDAFLTSQEGIYIYDGANWKRIARAEEVTGGGPSGWTIVGNEQYSNLTGNVGIGSTDPTQKLHVIGNILAENGTMTLNNPSAIFQMQNAGVNKGYLQLSGDNVRLGTNSGNTGGEFHLRLNGNVRMLVDSIGNIGMGTSAPNASAKLDIASTTKGVLLPRLTNSEMFGINNPANGLMVYNTNLNQFYHYDGGAWRSILNNTYWSRPITNRDRIANTADSIGIGTSGPLAKLHITGGTFADLNGHNGYITLGLTSSDNLVIGNYELQARDNGNASHLYLQQDGGAVHIGSGPVATGTALHANSSSVASLGTHGIAVFGQTSTDNIVFDQNNIQARNNSSANRLKLNEFGGPVQFGDGEEAPYPDTKIYIPDADGDEVSLTDDGMILMGRKDGTNIVMDENEIQARSGSSAATLYLQNYGGALDIGSHTTLKKTSGTGEVLRIDGTNPNIGFYQNGTYYSFISQSGSELFLGVNNGKMHLDALQIAIGAVNANAGAYKLSVSGKVICEELKVELYNDWPDYVFQETYPLRPLQELKEFIQTNKHLPNIPKATEVAKDGFEVGEMNRKLLEKVEELTLYVIQLQEQIDELREKSKE